MEEKKNEKLSFKLPSENKHETDVSEERAKTDGIQKFSLLSNAKEDESIGHYESASLATKNSIAIKNFEKVY